MFLAEPQRTPYDFQFQLLGFQVRVTPFFWLVGLIVGYGLMQTADAYLGPDSPGMGPLLFMWLLAFFLSILIHELGHAILMRRYGSEAQIVLYHFGGLAIASDYSSFVHGGRSRRPDQQIAISIAGPAAQMLLALVVILGIRLGGFQSGIPFGLVDSYFPPPEGRPLPAPSLDAMLFFLVAPSIYWALFNLLPIFPLDGGQISREIFGIFYGSRGFQNSLVLSLVTAACGAAYFLFGPGGSSFNAMLFLSLAASNFQLLQMMRFGRGPW